MLISLGLLRNLEYAAPLLVWLEEDIGYLNVVPGCNVI